jgi:MOSC domain-containing protein YiiM
VLVEGEVHQAGQPLELFERPSPEWKIARAFHVMSHRLTDRAAAARLADVPALADSWRQTLGKR